jgi:ribosomal subunit interface protein
MMDIRIVDGHIKTTPAMIEYVTSHVAAAIGSFADSFTSVDVHIRDENGPKGGVDKRCVIHAHAAHAGLGSLIVREKAEQFYQAIDLATKKLKRVISRRKQRVNDTRHHA